MRLRDAWHKWGDSARLPVAGRHPAGDQGATAWAVGSASRAGFS